MTSGHLPLTHQLVLPAVRLTAGHGMHALLLLLCCLACGQV
jgi:hypothetical protein